MQTEGNTKQNKIIPVYLPLVIALLAFLIIFLQVPHISRDDSHYFRMVLAMICLPALCVYYHFKNKAPHFSWTSGISKKATNPIARYYFIFLTILSLGGIFNYYQFDKSVFTGVGDYADVTYYYINSKYFEELGYFNLYPAMLIADEETGKSLHYVEVYRDLTHYKKVPRSHAFAETEKIKSRFTPKRWEEFRHDISFLVSKNIAGGWKYFFIDHGYNPPPTWTLIGGALSKITPVEHLKWITSIDLILIIIVMVVIAKTFSMEAMIISLLFFVTTFSGRWPILSHALLRFDWLSALVIAVAMLKTKRHGIAGALMTYAALNRIFPAIFFFPYIVWAGFDILRNKTLSQDQRRFIIGSAAMFSFLVVGALIFVGPSSFVESMTNLSMHASSESYSSHRVGLGDALVYRGETTRREMNQHGGITGKSEQLGEIMSSLKIAGLLSLVLIILYIRRVPLKAYQYIHLSMLPLFILTNPQINYYNVRLLLILTHVDGIDKTKNKIGLLLLFAIEMVTQYTKTLGVARYATTTTTSIGLVIYFITMIGFYTYEAIQSKGFNTKRSKI